MHIVSYPHPALKHPAKPLTHVDKPLRLQVAKMFELMYDAKGLGLAAPQVALPYRLVVVNLTGDAAKPEEERAYLNPRIVERKGIVEAEEGCLSFPGLWAKVKRARTIVVEAVDLDGNPLRIPAEGLEARAWQHELDHLDGVVFIERFSPLVRLARSGDVRRFEAKHRRLQEQGVLPADADIVRTLRALEAAAAAG